METMEENGWSLPAAIGTVVGKLHAYLESRSDSGKFKGTMKMLDLLEGKRDLLSEENLQRVKIDREEDLAEWLRLVKVATDDAQELVSDMEAEATAGNPASSDHSNHLRMKYTIGRLVSVFAEGEHIFVDVPGLESVRNDNTSLSFDHAPNLKEDASKDDMGDKGTSFRPDGKISDTKSLPHDDDLLVGRDKEISMIKDMVLNNAQYIAAAASLQSREQTENLHMSQKDWIIETLQNMDPSKKTEEVLLRENKTTEEAANVAIYEKQMCNEVEYSRLAHDDTVTNLRNPTVIPIVGTSGVGKSALARFIFQDGNVQEHFHGQSAWVYATDRINQDEVIKQIIFSFGPEHALPHLCYGMKDVRTVFQRIIEGKRFFLVLDDVWSEIDAIWGGLRSVLRDGAPGSVVLVTTRFFGVASSIGTTGPIVLHPLQYDDSWALLKHYVFADPFGSKSIQALEPISRKIADRLHGLPLAVKLIGASLRINLEESHWEKFLQGWWWNNRDDNLSISAISSLGSCYCELTGNTRQCFIFCSIFPRNYVFEKIKLVQMWIANGFVQMNINIDIRRFEDIAGEWFDELVNRAFLQPSACKSGYIMHDLVRDFASALASNECNGTSDNKLIDISQLRYLSIKMDDLTVQPAFYKQLRTLMVSGDSCELFSGKTCYDLDTILQSVTSLRMLDFSSSRWSGAALQFFRYCAENGYNLQVPQCLLTGLQTTLPFATREFPPLDAISGLKYLRHLDLSFTGINRLPNSLCSLCHLQVLCLLGCKFHMLPENMNSLINLRHFYAGSDTIAQIYGIGKLTKLQELHEFCVKAEDGHRITELRNLNDIRGSLCISNLEMVANPGEVLQANIAGKGHLTALELKWSDEFELQARVLASSLFTGVIGGLSLGSFGQKHVSRETEVLEGLSLPRSLQDVKKFGYPVSRETGVLEGLSLPRSLQDFRIFGYQGDAFPYMVRLLRHVRTLEISSCKMLHVLPHLGQLEHLQKLKLCNLPSIKDIKIEADGTYNVVFQSLEELSFEEMENWESWTYTGNKEFIPNLQKLRIFGCHKLRDVPFEHLGSSTKEMFIERCGPYAISSYLPRLTGLTRLEVRNNRENSGSRSDGTLTIPCEQFTCLEYLSVEGFCEVQMKGGLWHVRNMKGLWIFDCGPRLMEDKHVSTQSHHAMQSLTHLSISGHSLPKDLKSIFCYKLPCLQTLCFEYMWNFPVFTEKWLEQLTSLQEMELYWCHTLPLNLGILSSLNSLTIESGRVNYSIPANSIPRNLKELQIKRCSIELEARCQHPSGEIWPDEKKMAKWQSNKEEEWFSNKVEYLQRKLLEVRQKKEEQSRQVKKVGADKFNTTDKLESAKEELPRGVENNWLELLPTGAVASSVNDNDDGNEYDDEAVFEWLSKKLDEVLINDEEGTSNMKKERAEWLKEEKRRLLKLKGMDWPNIAHVPYIRINENIIQNRYI